MEDTREEMKEESFNIKMNGSLVDSILPNLDRRDRAFLCHKIAKMIKFVNDGCIDLYRIAKKGDKKSEAIYNETKSMGCCGYYDYEFTNKKTGNTFLVGCNYGH